MKGLRIRSASEQVADFLREEIQRRVWIGTMPGEHWLVNQLHTGRNTVRMALDLLEAEGVLLPQGHGRRRKIAPIDTPVTETFRVTIFLYCARDRQDANVHEIMHQLTKCGYEVKLAPKTLTDLDMNVARVAKMVKKIETDAWLVCAASSEVLNWFSTQATPSFAVFGRFSMSNMAGTGPDKLPAYKAAIRRLVELGHRRIVLLLPPQVRKPEIAQLPQQILCEMESHGIKISSYNLPDWESSPTGLRQCLDFLFSLTPPTALFIEEPFEFFAVRDHLAKKGIFAPRDVSLICSDYHPVFEWCDPSVSCIRWSVDPLVRRVIRWVENSKRGKEDRESSFFRASFIEGGSISAVTRLL